MDSIINKVLAFSTFLLVIWLGSTVNSSQQRITTLDAQLTTSLKQNIGVINARISTIVTEGESRHEEVLETVAALSEMTEVAMAGPSPEELIAVQSQLDAARGEAGKLRKSAELDLAHKHILEAELEKLTDSEAAAEKLLATKDAIWKFSLELPDHEAALQALMGPIDGLAAQWQGGDTTNSVSDVHSTLSAAVASLQE